MATIAEYDNPVVPAEPYQGLTGDTTHQYQDLQRSDSAHDYEPPPDMSHPVQQEKIATQGVGKAAQKLRCLKEDVIAIVVFFVVILHIALLACASLLPAFNAPPLPSFEDPVKGFEPRGTELSNRLVTLRLNAWGTDLTTYPKGRPASPPRIVNRKRKSIDFCGFNWNMLIAFESKSGGNLFNAKSFKAMCHLEEQIVRKHPSFPSNCYRKSRKCCPSFSLGNYVAFVVGKPSCQDITDQDVSIGSQILEKCTPYFIKGLLKLTCSCSVNANRTQVNTCPQVPCLCVQKRREMTVIMNYLTDSKFLLTPKDKFLKYSLIFSPVYWGSMRFYKEVYNSKLTETLPEYNGVKVVGFDFGNLKNNLFNYYLLENVKYPGIAMAALIIIMCLYLNSIILSFCGLISIIFALVDSYFLYKIVFGIKFFPFLNVATLIFLVGIGADDAFVYYDIWRQTKAAHPNADCMTLTWKTLRYAALSMFVTSLTTSAAFFASLSSPISSIKCFGIYAGMSVLTNYLMMITWFPAVVLLHERWVRKRTIDQSKGTNDQHSPQGDPGSQKMTRDGRQENNSSESDKTQEISPRPAQNQSLSCRICWGIDFPCHFIPGMKSFFGNVSNTIFQTWLPNAVLKFRLHFLWMIIFVGLTIGFLCVIFVSPTMTLPTSKDFQVFPSSSTLEQYEMKIKYNFRYAQGQGWGMPIDIVWGAKAADNGNHLNPDELGTLEFEDSFDPYSRESQQWLLDFSKALVNQTMYSKSNAPETPFENFINYANNTCLKGYSFPYPSEKYEECYRNLSFSNYIYFDAKGKAKAMKFRFQTDTSYTSAFQEMDAFWNDVNSWMTKELSKAPKGLKNGWAACTYLDFYALQLGLSSGSFTSMGISVAIAFAVMLLTTLNIFISLYAIVTIIGILAITVGTLVLLGWQLNILESIVLSVAVGLSIDFTMHYGVAYRLSPHKERRDLRVRYSFMHIGSAIFMAAITTFITGALMMPSVVLVYNQLGVFLMLVMFFSYLYSTFVFQSFCAAIGPTNNFGQLSLSKFCPRRCRVNPDDESLITTQEEMAPVVDEKPPPSPRKGSPSRDGEKDEIVTVL